MKAKTQQGAGELRREYEFDYSKAVRGKYYKRLMEEGANIVVLDPDVVKVFADSAAVNSALRLLMGLATPARRLAQSPPRPRTRISPRKRIGEKVNRPR
ncbi:MAG: hypothetical protein K1X53_02425 [Candidatus Sumerlaeaceae bacterium]|nr:hypothetical protein [Candidatus Sumerlaeaceae bacterium]